MAKDPYKKDKNNGMDGWTNGWMNGWMGGQASKAECRVVCMQLKKGPVIFYYTQLSKWWVFLDK